MLLIIGKENCSRCNMTKSVLDNKKIEYTYKLREEIEREEFNNYIKKINSKKIMNFPLIIRDEKIITLEDIIE